MTSPKLTFGYLYDLRNPPAWHRPWSELYAETIELIAWTESVGFAGAWIPEHHLAEDGYIPAPNLILAAIAARTSTIRLGTAVALAPLYDPVRFAEECAVLDILSNGRLDVALAIGYRKREYAALGVPFGTRGKRFDEFLQIVRALWAGETVSFAGEHYRVEGARIMPPAPQRTIPLYVGGFADKALDRVARHADGYYGNEEVYDRYAAKLPAYGKDPANGRIRIPDLFLTVARDPDDAFDELAPFYLHVNNSYGEWNAKDNALGLDLRWTRRDGRRGVSQERHPAHPDAGRGHRPLPGFARARAGRACHDGTPARPRRRTLSRLREAVRRRGHARLRLTTTPTTIAAARLRSVPPIGTTRAAGTGRMRRVSAARTPPAIAGRTRLVLRPALLALGLLGFARRRGQARRLACEILGQRQRHQLDAGQPLDVAQVGLLVGRDEADRRCRRRRRARCGRCGGHTARARWASRS